MQESVLEQASKKRAANDLRSIQRRDSYFAQDWLRAYMDRDTNDGEATAIVSEQQVGLQAGSGYRTQEESR